MRSILPVDDTLTISVTVPHTFTAFLAGTTTFH
jgi:hypothetical protein